MYGIAVLGAYLFEYLYSNSQLSVQGKILNISFLPVYHDYVIIVGYDRRNYFF